ncbi:hypothetical protein EB796_014367 [Bugula neritina]|uniref:Uncharacterized protein n=1 Tax=Bugula neritina TaxID=10212 RepID=A0A7J7JMR5_BUGNE|nr:hypothetical protein EB796_014367 [Bugula neritina]
MLSCNAVQYVGACLWCCHSSPQQLLFYAASSKFRSWLSRHICNLPANPTNTSTITLPAFCCYLFHLCAD